MDYFFFSFFNEPFGKVLYSGWAISFCRWAVAHPVNMLRLGLVALDSFKVNKNGILVCFRRS